jgi:preprotein translocase subunit SecG
MLFWTNAAIDALLFFYVIVCALMCLVILMQRSKQEGLGAAFGGGFTESVWGAQTSQVLVKATVWLAALFFIISIALARLYSHHAALIDKGSPVQQQLLMPVAPSKTPASTSATNAAPATAPAASTAPAPTNPTPATPASPVAK